MRANRYVSYLATEIEPSAMSTLSQFERATEQAFNRIGQFNQRGAARITGVNIAPVDQRVQRSIAETNAGLQRVQTTGARTAPVLRAVATETNAMSTALFRSAQALNVVQGPLGPLAGRLSSLGYIFRDLAGFSLASVLSGGGAFALAGVASGYQNVLNRLRPFYDTQVQVNSAMSDVIRIAQETRQALDPVAQLYTRINQAGKSLGLSDQTAPLTTTVAKAARLSGGDEQAQQAGLTQFAQAFGSNTFGGDELRSIRENTFRLAKAIADGLGVPLAKLKELGAEGKLTSEVVAAALARSAGAIELEYSRLPKTIGSSLTEAKNNLEVFIGRLDQSVGATAGFASAISVLGNNLQGITVGVAGLAAAFATRNLAAPVSAAAKSIRGLVAEQVNMKTKAQLAVDVAANQLAAEQRLLLQLDAERAAILNGTAAIESNGATALAAARAKEAAQRGVIAAIKEEGAARAAAAIGAATTPRPANTPAAATPRAPSTGVAQMRANIATGQENIARASVAGIQTQIDKLREKDGAERASAAAARAAAEQEVLATTTRVNAARAAVEIITGINAEETAAVERQAAARLAIAEREVASLTAIRAAADQRFAAARQTVSAVRADPNLSRADSARLAANAVRQMELANLEAAAADDQLTAATNRQTAALAGLNAARRALYEGQGVTTAQTAQQTAAQEALSVAIAQQTAAEEALAAAERAESAAAAQGATAGFAALTLAEQRIAAETQLAGAVAARGAAESAVAAGTAAARGMAFLTTAEQRIAAETRLARIMQIRANIENAVNDSTGIRRGLAALSVAEKQIALNQAVAASTRTKEIAERAYAAAASFSSRATALLSTGMSKLVGLLGGPFGIAITGVTLGFTYLATRTDEATEAAQRFQAEQEATAAKLGTTTAALMNQTEAARQLAIALADAGIEQAKQRKQAAGSSLAASLTEASGRINLLTSQGRQDFARLREISGNLSNGQNSTTTYAELAAIRKRNPGAFNSDPFSRLLGSDPSMIGTKSAGFIQTDRELQRAVQSRKELEAQLGKPLPPPPALGGGGTGRRTVEQLQAYAKDAAEGGTILAQAREKFAKTKADLDAKLAERRKAGDYSFDDEYVRQLSAAQTALNKVGDGQRAAAAGAREHRAALAEQRKEIAAETAELKAARSRGDTLASIDAKYDDQPSAADAAQKAKDQLDAFFTQIKDGKVVVLDTVKILDQATGQLFDFTRASAEARKNAIDAATLKPATDAVRDSERELEIQRLVLAGRADEGDLLRQRYQLTDQIGTLEGKNLATFNAQMAALRGNAIQQRVINDQIAQRNRLIEVQARAFGTVQTSVRDAYRTLLDGNFKGLADVGKNLLSSFKDQLADKFSISIFGDAEQQARDKMTNAFQTSANAVTASAGDLTGSATNLTSSATNVATAADKLAAASDRIASSTGLGGASPTSPAALAASPEVSALSNLLVQRTSAAPAVDLSPYLDKVTDVAEEVQVIAKRPISIEDRYNQAGTKIATDLKLPKPLVDTFGKLGTFLSGAGTGLATNSILGIGGQGSGAKIGAAIGGGLGKTLLGGTGGFLAKGLTAISSKLGSFAGPLGSIAGSILGSVLGGLFDKPKSGTASVTGQGKSGIQTTGSNSTLAANAGSLGSGVQSGLQKIADALNGTVGQYSVAIGLFDNKYRVNKDATTKSLNFNNFNSSTLTNFGDDKEGAVRYAILDALQDGAIDGIREGTKRILAAGEDLDSALNDALSFEQVFRDLKSYTDPVGAAIDDLNRQFDHLIDIFNKAGASSDEFAQLQQLYDFKRADAIKNATNGAIDSLDSFIKNLKGGNDSPLSRQTVYANSKAEVDKFRADLAAGKTVDTDKLLEALGNFQDASQELNGSRSEFYTDFNDILALAEKAKSNQEIATNSGGTLPASPFDPATSNAIQQTAQNTADLGNILKDGFGNLASLFGGGGGYGGGGSSLDFLPSNLQRAS